ncbi:mechanosensitive ion channel family protein [Ileibacterium valens]|uniref:mechanosensitive ion channel family protein n=1 Tax=Ileibacterium valens TaxID=1862668 RepID=UPI00272A8294|nr:mechanosensitive ion channel domain-containing protein [Ileibacterium valens]
MNSILVMNYLSKMDWSKLKNDIGNYDLLIRLILASGEIAAAFIIGSLVKTMILKMANKALNKGIMTFFASFCNITIKIVGIIIALDQIGVAMNIIIGALSAFGVGISLALKDNMASVASGMQILLTKPFRVGDIVKIGHHEGRVESVEMTYITLLTKDNQIDVVPNNKVVSKIIKNYSNEPNRKITVEFPVPNDKVDYYISLLEHAASKVSLINPEPKPEAYISSYQLNKVSLNLTCYAKQEDYWQAYYDLLAVIHKESYGDLKVENASDDQVEENQSLDSSSELENEKNESNSDKNTNQTSKSPIQKILSAIKSDN